MTEEIGLKFDDGKDDYLFDETLWTKLLRRVEAGKYKYLSTATLCMLTAAFKEENWEVLYTTLCILDEQITKEYWKGTASYYLGQARKAKVWEIREHGAEKYGSFTNYKNVALVRYIKALLRHIMEWLEHPEGMDKDSGKSIIGHLFCNIDFACEKTMEVIEDDRKDFWRGTHFGNQ